MDCRPPNSAWRLGGDDPVGHLVEVGPDYAGRRDEGIESHSWPGHECRCGPCPELLEEDRRSSDPADDSRYRKLQVGLPWAEQNGRPVAFVDVVHPSGDESIHLYVNGDSSGRA